MESSPKIPFKQFKSFRFERIERERLPGFHFLNGWNDLNGWNEFFLKRYGYDLGYWSDRNREEAELALQGKHFEIGERAKAERKKLD